MKKQEALTLVQGLKDDEEIVVRKTDEDKTFLANYETQVINGKLQAKVDEATASIHSRYDADLQEVLGVVKPANEKTYVFLKGQLKALKEKADKVTTLEAEIAELKKTGKVDPVLQAELEQAKKMYADLNKKYTDETTGAQKTISGMKVQHALATAMMGMQFNSTLPESVVKNFIATKTAELVGRAKIEGEKIVFVDAAGQPMLNPTTLAPMTAQEILKAELKDIIAEEKKVPGSGTEKPTIIKTDDKEDIVIQLPADVTTQHKLTEYLMSKGLTRDSKEFQMAFVKYGKALPIM